jgi:hypothetical protein
LEDEFTQVSKMTSLGITSLCIRLEIIYLPKGIILHQQHYASILLRWFKMFGDIEVFYIPMTSQQLGIFM